MANLSWSIMQLIDCCLYLFLGYSLFGEKIKGNKKIYMSFLLIAICIFTLEHYTHITLAFILPILLLFMMSQTYIIHRSVIVLSVVCIIMIIQQYLALSLFPYEIMNNNRQIDLYSICCAFVVIGVSFFIKYVREHLKFVIHLSDIPSYIYMNIILGICAGILPLTLVNYLENEIPIRLRISILCVSYFSIICSLISVFVFVKNYKEKDGLKKQNQLKNELLNMQERYFIDTVKNYEHLRKFKHDIQGHFRVISQLESQKSYNELHSYIQKLKMTMQKEQVFQCSHSHISAIVNSYIEDMKSENIELKVIYSVTGFIKIDVIDLDSVVYNLLSNAFEAEKKVGKDEKIITLNFMGSQEDLLIEIVNDVNDDECINFIRKNKTSKKDKFNHGIGIKNIKDIANKYNGDIDIQIENGRLSIEVFFNNVIDIGKEDE